MAERPFFSIITVCYNSEKTIETTIKSVLNQTEQDFEYIIVDGQSTDKTLDIIQKYESKFNGKLRWISGKDNGIYDAMNKGIQLAQGKLIGIINSDDWYETEALTHMRDAYTGKEVLLHGKMTMMVDEETVAIVCFNKLNYQLIEKACIIYHPTCFVPRKTYKIYGAYNDAYRISADYDFFYRLIKAQEPISFVNQPIACMRTGGASGQSVQLNLKENYDIRRANGQGLLKAWGYTAREYVRHGLLTLKSKIRG